MTIRAAIYAMSLGLAFLGCSEAGTGGEQQEQPAKAGLPAGHPVIPEAAAGANAGVLEGVVVQTIDAGGYTYARVETGSGDIWVAGPVTPLVVGKTLEVHGAALMEDFASSSLGRTFDEIYFVGAFGKSVPPQNGRRGLAREVLSGSGYTYVEVHVNDAISWIAGPAADVQPGDTVVWQGGTEMGAFHSRSMDRTFDNILFVERIWVAR